MGQIKFWIDAKLHSLVIDKSEVVCVLQQHRHLANKYEDIVRLTEGCISWQPKLPQILSRIAVFTVLRIYCSYKTVAYVGSFLEEIRWLQSYLLPPPRRLCFACVCLSVCLLLQNQNEQDETDYCKQNIDARLPSLRWDVPCFQTHEMRRRLKVQHLRLDQLIWSWNRDYVPTKWFDRWLKMMLCCTVSVCYTFITL